MHRDDRRRLRDAAARVAVWAAEAQQVITWRASVEDEADRRKALGFVERSGAKIFGGLPDGEMDFLNDAVRLTQEERDMLVRWGGGGSYDSRTQTQGSRPGMGKFLIKMSHEPGIPMEVHMTDMEAEVNDTNQRWNK